MSTSNETQKASDVVTASAPNSKQPPKNDIPSKGELEAHKKSGLRAVKPGKVIAVTLAIVAILLPYVFYAQQKSGVAVNLGGVTYHMTRVDTPQKREQGLSGKAALADKTGMLFVFDSAAQQCFWMKDMQFDLDILWLDSTKHIVALKQDASKNSYPEQFCPPDNAQYVIEVPAGTVASQKLAVGQQLQFEL